MSTKILCSCFTVGFLSLTQSMWVFAQDASTEVTAKGAEIKLLSADYQFTEGPASDAHGNVFFTDQPNDRILRWSTDGKIETWMQPCGRSNGLFFDREQNLIACADERNELWKIAPDKTHDVLVTGFEGKLFNGPNDVWVGGDGSLYFTDPFYKRPYWKRAEASQLPQRVYRMSPDYKQVTIAAEDFRQPNGIVGDAKKKLVFVADIGANKTYRFTIAESGELVDRQLFCEMGSDGMTIDSQGNLYLTGKGVTVFSSTGKKIQTIAVPESWTANVCFGGQENKTLFITASDSVYTIAMQVTGLK